MVSGAEEPDKAFPRRCKRSPMDRLGDEEMDRLKSGAELAKNIFRYVLNKAVVEQQLWERLPYYVESGINGENNGSVRAVLWVVM